MGTIGHSSFAQQRENERLLSKSAVADKQVKEIEKKIADVQKSYAELEKKVVSLQKAIELLQKK